MAKKKFISFLGAGNYTKCIYSKDENRSKEVVYVQSALIDLVAKDYDEYYIFCTKSSKDKHFNLLAEEAKVRLTDLAIPDGLSEKEIWEIFQIVFSALEDEDEVILDITHSFRFLPMLGNTLLNYAKFTKSIKVKGIYYGAFDAKDSNNIVPIIDLTSFSILQDWANFGSEFISSGKADNLINLTDNIIKPILRESKGKNEQGKNLEKISKKISEVSLDFRTNRGSEIMNAQSISELKGLFQEIEGNLLPAFSPIIKKLEQQFQNYREDDINNLFLGVEWCIEKGLIQQGITMLQESVITVLCTAIHHDHKDRCTRDIISSFLAVGFHLPKEKWDKKLKCELAIEIISKLKEINDIKELAKSYNALSEKRNDINHAGFTNPKKQEKPVSSSKFAPALEKSYNEIKKILNASQLL